MTDELNIAVTLHGLIRDKHRILRKDLRKPADQVEASRLRTADAQVRRIPDVIVPLTNTEGGYY